MLPFHPVFLTFPRQLSFTTFKAFNALTKFSELFGKGMSSKWSRSLENELPPGYPSNTLIGTHYIYIMLSNEACIADDLFYLMVCYLVFASENNLSTNREEYVMELEQPFP